MMKRAQFGFERRRIPLGSLLLAAIFTLLVFILLPALETVRGHEGEELEIRTVETLALEAPPPPVTPPVTPPKEREEREAPRPELRQSAEQIPLNAVLDLDFGLAREGGDFALDFDIAAAGAEAIDKNIFDLDEIDRDPVAIVKNPPIYPIRAKMRRIEGDVVLQFVVDEQGAVRELSVAESTPPGVFDSAALRTVARWRFKPGIKDERPVAVRVQQKLKFRLER